MVTPTQDPSTVHDWIDRWQHRALVDAPTAQALHDDVRTATASGPGPDRDDRTAVDVGRVFDTARRVAAEALGYLGAALVLGTTVVLLDVPEWDGAVIGLLVAAVAVVAGWGLWTLTPPADGARARLAAVLGAAATAAAGGAVALLWEVDADLPATATALAVAAAVYARHAHAVTHVALGCSTLGVVFAVADTVQGSGDHDVFDLTVGLLLLGVGVGWVVLSELDVLRPAWLGTPVAGIASLIGVFTIIETGLDAGDDAAILGQLAMAVAYLAAGLAASRLRVTVVGVAGMVWGVPWTFTDVLGWSGQATALVMLPVGVALIVWAVRVSRSD